MVQGVAVQLATLKNQNEILQAQLNSLQKQTTFNASFTSN